MNTIVSIWVFKLQPDCYSTRGSGKDNIHLSLWIICFQKDAIRFVEYAPATFQMCMMSIFSDMIEQTLEVFIDDFSIFRETYDDFLHNLENALKRCEETNLMLN